MYHEERVINGVLCWRGHPDDEFRPYSPEELTRRLEQAVKMIHQHATGDWPERVKQEQAY